MGQKAGTQRSKAIQHEIKSPSTSEAGQLPADPHDMKQLEPDTESSDNIG
jgi:hypothetical protein